MKMKTVNSTLRMEDVDKSAVCRLIDGLRSQRDIPCSDVDIEELSDSALDVTFRYPIDIFDHSVSQFMAVVFGEFPFMRSLGRVKFVDLTLPTEAHGWFGGPRFGVDGLLDRFKVKEFPFLMAIVKPSVGLDRNALEDKLVGPLGAGFHAVKDDEMLGNVPSLPLAERLDLAAQYPGYIPTVNLDGAEDIKKVLSRKELSMILVNATILGFPMLHALSQVTDVPLLSHLSLQGTYAATFDHRVFALLHRLFGCDALITPIGDEGYYRATKLEERGMVQALVGDELPMKRTLPLLTGGARHSNLKEIITPYEDGRTPYGVVFGNLVYQSERPPREMAAAVVSQVASIKHQLARGSR